MSCTPIRLPRRLVYPDDAQLMQVLTRPAARVRLSRWVRRDGGWSRPVRCVLIRDATGRARYVDGVIRNVTAREEDRQRPVHPSARATAAARSDGSAAARVLIVDDHDLTGLDSAACCRKIPTWR
jgi:hypothetical protein